MRTGDFKDSYGGLVALGGSATVWCWTALFGLGLLALPLLAGAYSLTLAVTILVTVVGAIGLNLLTGTTGLISLGQSGFLAIGAYANAILLTDHGWPVWASLPAAGLVAAAISLLVGIPSLRLKGLYLAITTLAFSFIVNYVILYFEDVTHGSNGIFIGEVAIFGFDLSSDRPLYYFAAGIAVLVALGALNLGRTRIGRAWLAIRDHDIAARAMGIDLVRYKLLAFFISSYFVGIAGALMSLQIRFVNIDTFGFLLSIEALAVIILGGLGSVAGAVLGAVFLTLLPEAIRLVLSLVADPNASTDSKYIYEIRAITYGVVIVLFLRFKPDGLIGLWRDVRKFFANWPFAY